MGEHKLRMWETRVGYKHDRAFIITENSSNPPDAITFEAPKKKTYFKWDKDVTIHNWKKTFPLNESLGTKRFDVWYSVYLNEKDQNKVDHEVEKYVLKRFKEDKSKTEVRIGKIRFLK